MIGLLHTAAGNHRMTEQSHYRTCHLCEALCGIEIRHEGEQIFSIRGDKQDSFSRGHICPKAVALQDLQNDPDRLRAPMRRTDNGWEEISWEEALDYTARRLSKIRHQHGKDAVGVYAGNPTAHNHGAMFLLGPLLGALNTRNRFSATSADQLPHMLASLEMFGNQALLPVPDLDRTDCWLVLGGNPMASNGSIMTAPDIHNRIKAIQARGGKVIVVDPRRSETAKVADQYIPIRPGGDAWLLLGLLHCLFRDQLADPAALTDIVDGLAELESLVAEFSPTNVSAHCGIPEAQIEQLAKALASANSAAVYGRVGLTTSPNSTVGGWLLWAINIVTGNLDKPGGMMFTQPAFDIVGIAALAGVKGSFDNYRSRVRGLPEFGGEFPVVTLADEISTPGEGQIRALVTHAGNPVLSTPDGKSLEAALPKLDFMVSIDMYINETTRHADIILPPVGPLERGQFDPVFHFVAIRNTIKYAPAMLPPPKGALRDWEILLELTSRLLDTGTFTQRLMGRSLRSIITALGDEGLIDLGLRLGPYGNQGSALRLLDKIAKHTPGGRLLWPGIRRQINARLRRLSNFITPYLDDYEGEAGLTLDKVKAQAHGIDLGPLRPMLPGRLGTADQRIKLTPPLFVKALQSMRNSQAEAPEFVMIGRRHLRSNNSWMHNSKRLVKGKPRCTVMMHPQDGVGIGVEEGADLEVRSATGAIQLPVEFSTDMLRGVISVPHGWGHHREGIQQQVAAAHAGVSINDVIGSQTYDPLTGMAILNGVDVQLRAISASKTKTAA